MAYEDGKPAVLETLSVLLRRGKSGVTKNIPILWCEPMKGQKWEVLDAMLESLQDLQWHSVKEIEEKSGLPEEKLASVLSFFADFDFISRAGEKSKAKITPLGLSFLALPRE